MIKFKNFLALLLPYKKDVTLSILFNMLFVCFSFFSLALIAPFLGLIFGLVDKLDTPPIFAWNTDAIIQYIYYHIGQFQLEYGAFLSLVLVCALFVAFSFLSNLFRYLGVYFLAPIRAGVIKDIRNKLFTHIVNLPLSYFSEQRKGDLLSRSNSDMTEIEWSIVASIQSLVKDPLNVIVFLLALVAISPSLVLFVILVLPVTAYIISKIGRNLKRDTEKSQRRMGRLISIIEESISGLRIVKSFNLIEYSAEQFAKSHRIYTKIVNRTQQRRDLADPLTEFLSIISLVLILLFGGLLVLKNEIRADVLILFVLLFARLLSPAKAAVNSFFNLQRGRAALHRVNEILKEEVLIFDTPQATSKKEFESQIEFKDLTFTYESSDEEAISNFNLCIQKGQTLALVGESGSGKTSLVDLLSRFYDPIQGGIYIDGINIKDIKIEDLRSMIGMVSQFPFLWNDSIASNIQFGLGKSSYVIENDECVQVLDRKKIKDAAVKAQADGFIMETPQGYDTMVGDLGTRLSGGQKQRIAIARAIFKNAPILILDEATSALDSESEKLVQKALKELMKGKTSIIIAHRLSTVQHADVIVVMEKGKIVEKGKHQDLMEQKGAYYRLVNMQSLM